jgi:hypothetical protein
VTCVARCSQSAKNVSVTVVILFVSLCKYNFPALGLEKKLYDECNMIGV